MRRAGQLARPMMYGNIIRAILTLLAWLGVAVTLPAHAQTTVRYIHTDALGSVVAETDSAGNVVARREYEPYGQQLTPALQDGPGYTGHVQDAATGLTYMQQRYYDPMLAVFLSVDPIAPLGDTYHQFNRYRYGNSNPYRFTDPDGRRACGKDWDCRMAQQSGGISFSRGQITAVAKNPAAAIDKFNSIPNLQQTEAGSSRYFRNTAGLVTKASGLEVHADIASLGANRRTVVNYTLGTKDSVEVLASYSGPGVRVAIAHTHPENTSFSGRPAVYNGRWGGGFLSRDMERAYAVSEARGAGVNAYVIGIDGGIQKFDMNRMWEDVSANRNGYFNADDYISEIK
ncbi:RHS repeat-associated core domain-containing protein [Luteimonas sp. XNQY3]|nr:RHS repeat-associated core domain-containing protein [Luteimonas sp. XNQY3]MCD9004636.1 RHS repeat-associated core domain-containing protein [Luteimonas sp. XNQY3]